MLINRLIGKEDVVYVYTMDYLLLSHKKNEIISFAATRMDLEIIILSEVSQTKRNMIYKKSYANELILKTEIDSQT